MRTFNTSGPNIPGQHYTIERTALIAQGMRMASQARYFTIWAPRQTGKSTYFLQLAARLEADGYQVAHISFESYRRAPEETFLKNLAGDLNRFWGVSLPRTNLADLFYEIEQIQDRKLVLIVDEVEGINPEYFGVFLHAIRRAYHTRERHSLRSVIIVGVTNILGVVSDNASPFNIADNLEVPYFTDAEVVDLLGQHERETGQRFDPQVVAKISQITANQPGLVNGFARKLVENYPSSPLLTYEAYLKVEDWYLTEAIDKNFENILSKAREERPFVERLLFAGDSIPFQIDRPSIKVLHANGLIRKDDEGNTVFWVPFYKKRLYQAFYPYTNGEKARISRTLYAPEYFGSDGTLSFDRIIGAYKAYVKRRGFAPFREKDEQGRYTSIREAALIYSFETFIDAMIQELGGHIYREAQAGLGKSDMIVSVGGQEILLEFKVYYSPGRFAEGKRQLAYYCSRLGLRSGVYLVFCPGSIRYPEAVREGEVQIGGVTVQTYLVEYDEEGWE